MFRKFLVKATAVLFTLASLQLTAPVITKVIPQDLLPISGTAAAACLLPYTFHNYVPGGPTQPINADQLNANLQALAGCIQSNGNIEATNAPFPRLEADRAADRVNLLDYASGSGQTTTGSMTAGQKTLSLGSALDFGTAPVCAIGGTYCGIVVGGAGSATTNLPTTGFTVASNCFLLQPTVTTTSGSTVLSNVLALSGVMPGDTITGTGIPGGTTVLVVDLAHNIIAMSQQATASGTVSATIQDPCNKPYFYRIATFDQTGGITTQQASSTASGPLNLSTWNLNCLTWTRPSSGIPAGYIVWRSLDGVTFHFFNVANFEGSGTCSAGSNGPLWDGGQPPASRPWWIPDDPSTIASNGQKEWLRTTVTAGVGTTTLTLAAAATSTTSGAYVAHDDTPGWLQWEAQIQNLGGTGYIPGHIAASGQDAVYRIAQSNPFTVPNVRIVGDRGASINPFGSAFTGGIFQFFGATPSNITPAINGVVQEGQTCVPLTTTAGLSLGQWLIIQQQAPGGPSESVPYTVLTPIATTKCNNANTVGIQLTDSAPVTFTDPNHTELATVTGVLAAGDVLTVAANPSVCTASYTVVNGDSIATVGQNLAAALNGACPFTFSTNTFGAVTIQIDPSSAVSSWTGSATHGGGGSEVVTMTVGTGATIQTLNPLTNVGVDGVFINATDATGNQAVNTDLTGFYLSSTAASSFTNLELLNFDKTGDAFYSTFSHGNTYQNIYIVAGASGTPNITSYSDFWLNYTTSDSVNNILSSNSLGFGPQFLAGAHLSVNGVRARNTFFGRGVKFAGTAHSSFNDIRAEGAVFDNIAICCGTFRNSFSNIYAEGSVGVNPGGVVLFNAWDRNNQFANIHASGNVFDIFLGATDTGNTWANVDTSTGGGYLTTTVSNNSNLFTNFNQCEFVFNPTPTLTATPACQRAQGSWTPTLNGTGSNPTVTYTTQLGSWEQVNNTVTVRFNITATFGAGFTGNMQIIGLPLPPFVETGTCNLLVGQGITLDTGYTQFGAGVSSNAINLIESGSGFIQANIPTAHVSSPVTVNGSCSYRVY